jgi:hypothetical protein
MGAAVINGQPGIAEIRFSAPNKDADEEQFLPRIVPINLGCQLANPGSQLLLRHEDSRQITAELTGVH